MSKPRLLDLFCCQGGAAMGYHRAGFEVVGVDITPQPRYPFEFVQADAIMYLRANWRKFDAVHASPPCQAYTALRTLHNKEHPQLVEPTRQALKASGLPYVIENVPGAPLRDAIILCGSAFNLGATCRDGVQRQLRRHRLFESNIGLESPGCRHDGSQALGVYGHGGTPATKRLRDGREVNRSYAACKVDAATALQIDWMTRDGLSQSIPPAYTEYIGQHLLASINERQEAA